MRPERQPAAAITPENYFAGYPAPVRAAGEKLRALVLDCLPGAVERYYAGWKLVGYRIPVGASTKYCCYLYATAKHVELGFERGTRLADPDGVLEGSGTQVRKVVCRTAAEVRPVIIRRLLREAALITKETIR